MQPVDAQEHFEALRDTTPWLQSRNVAGLAALPDGVRSNYAEAYFSKEDGGWGEYYSSPDSYEFGACTASYFRVSPRLAMSGAVSYANFTGRDMTGSVWLDPDDQPFDIVEIDPQYAGTKNLERYNLAGALSYNLGQGFSLGASVDFTAANRAKRRDLRTQNKLMDLDCTMGVVWMGDLWQVGVSYAFRRTLEELLFKTYGTTGTFYSSLIDYGAAMGVSEYSNASGLTEEDEARPMLSSRHAIALQLGLHLGTLRWVNEASLEWRNGYYGKQSLYTPVFMEHSGHAWRYGGHFAWQRRHTARFGLEGQRLENWQNLYNYVNQGGGLNEYLYYGQLKTRGSRTFSTFANYQYYGETWVHRIGVAYDERRLTSSYYPFYRRQSLHFMHAEVASRRIWKEGPHDWSAELQLAYQQGGGTMAEDGWYGEAASSQTTALIRTNLVTLPTALQQHYDYLTAPQGCAALRLLYGHTLRSARLRLFALLDFRFQHAWSVTADVEKHHQAISLALGCTF